MPLTRTKRNKSSKRTSPSIRVCRKKHTSPDRSRICWPSPSPTRKQQRVKNRSKNSSDNNQETAKSVRGTKRGVKIKEYPLEKRLNKIITELGLIPGDRAMDFALAYDSISHLLKARCSLGIKPPISPLNDQKFNLLYVPEEYTPAMRKMKLINKYSEDILFGIRKNTQINCNLDERFEMLKQEIGELEQAIGLTANVPTIFKKVSRSPKSGWGILKKVSRSIKNFKNVSSNKYLNEESCIFDGPSREAAVSPQRRLRKSRSMLAPRSISKRLAEVATMPTSSCRPRKRHQSTNTYPYGVKTFSQRDPCERNNLPIFYKHIKVHKWL